MGTVRQASLVAHAQSPRGKLARSGTPERKSATSRGGGTGPDAGRRAGVAGQVALGQQLAVALLDQSAGDAKLAGKLPG